MPNPLPQASTPPSFVDLRQFARDPNQGNAVAAAAGEDRFLASRRCLDWAPGPVTAGVITLGAGGGAVPSMPADEFIIVDEGRVTLSYPDADLTLEAGQSAVIQQGAAFSWSADGPVSLIFARYNGSQPGERAIVPIKENPQLEPSGTPLAELLLTPTPACRNYTDYRSADGEFVCGTWDSTPYHRRAMLYRHFELMYLLEGSVTFVDETGREGRFSKGDIFLVEQGARCSWESREHVAKVYVIYRPA
ncbi:cupin domain-containing protein [Massilia terrae]|uniref:Cupin domain-containing protein n=1 Tax=Massilia terrae TaxID=1811224 RepID=A0ABT2D2W7_9BURK|nr:cupin domain-containing protein [Massilia terrae]MCS0660571.1 cupin domain-containing protein [Massilia terrae]